jgi:hypothetical protein
MLKSPLNVTLPCAVRPRMCFGVSAKSFGSKGRSNPLPFAELAFVTETNCSAHIFCSRSSAKFDYCDDLAARQSPSASIRKNLEKCSVIPIGYALLEICFRGPQFKERVAANLAAFASASASAIGGRRNRK